MPIKNYIVENKINKKKLFYELSFNKIHKNFNYYYEALLIKPKIKDKYITILLNEINVQLKKQANKDIDFMQVDAIIDISKQRIKDKI